MLFRRLRLLLPGKRRYRDAAYLRPNLTQRTEAAWWERVLRALRRKEEFGYDEREARAGDFVRLTLGSALLLLFCLFLVRSLLVINFFAG
jgi:hypothetical protein